MSALRMHHYTVDPANVDEFRTRRKAAIAAIRAAHPAAVALTQDDTAQNGELVDEQ